MLMGKMPLAGGRVLVILGIEKHEIEMLKAGQAFRHDLKSIGLTGDCLVFAGKTKETMLTEIEKLGVNTSMGRS